MNSLDSLRAEQDLEPVADPEAPPFRGGRMLLLRYELGRALLSGDNRVTLNLPLLHAIKRALCSYQQLIHSIRY